MTSRPRVIELPASFEAVNEYAYVQGWTDGLPVVPPTEERVQLMVNGSSRQGADIIGVLGPKKGLATVEKIAAQAVMAGCMPEYMPVILAIVEALADPAFNLDGVQSTTSPCCPFVIANGPVVQDLKMNTGRNALGPGNRANATLGRAVRLLLLNIGGGVPEEVDKAILGFPGKYTCCLGEAEAQSPWEPYHVERGFTRGASAITIVAVQGTISLNLGKMKTPYLLECLAQSLSNIGHNDIQLGGGEPVIIASVGLALRLADEGYTKAAVKAGIYEQAGIPVQGLEAKMNRRAERTMKGNVVAGLAKPAKKAEDIIVLVAGGPEDYHTTVMPTFGDTRSVTRPVAWPARPR
ncbi:MAG: hypothetical protein AAB369_03640 [Chloroflexota bacterium]